MLFISATLLPSGKTGNQVFEQERRTIGKGKLFEPAAQAELLVARQSFSISSLIGALEYPATTGHDAEVFIFQSALAQRSFQGSTWH